MCCSGEKRRPACDYVMSREGQGPRTPPRDLSLRYDVYGLCRTAAPTMTTE